MSCSRIIEETDPIISKAINFSDAARVDDADTASGLKVVYPVMEGLVLRNVLEYASGRVVDYKNFSLVSKEWNKVMGNVKPPCMDGGSVLNKILEFAYGGSVVEYRNFTLVSKAWRKTMEKLEPPCMAQLSMITINWDQHKNNAGHFLVFRDVLTEIRANPESVLRWEKRDGPFWWKNIRSQVSISTYVLAVSDGGNSVGACRRLVQIVKKQLELLSQDTIDKMCPILQQLATVNYNNKGCSAFVKALEQLLIEYNKWQHLAAVLDKQGRHLDLYYLRPHGLPSLIEHSCKSFVRAFIALCDHDTVLEAIENFTHHLSGYNNNNRTWKRLLVRILSAYNTRPADLAWPINHDPDIPHGTIYARLNRTRSLIEDAVGRPSAPN